MTTRIYFEKRGSYGCVHVTYSVSLCVRSRVDAEGISPSIGPEVIFLCEHTRFGGATSELTLAAAEMPLSAFHVRSIPVPHCMILLALLVVYTCALSVLREGPSPMFR